MAKAKKRAKVPARASSNARAAEKPSPHKPKTPVSPPRAAGALRLEARELVRLKLDQLKDFQGRFKLAPPEEMQKLKAALATHGLVTPLHVWAKRPGEYLLLDGHQRVAALKAMQAEGYAVPLIPVVLVRASDEAEAARKVLALASTYGTVDPEGLTAFLATAGLDLPAAARAYSFPDMDLQALALTVLTDRPLPTGATTVDLGALATSLKHTCPGCGFRF